MSSSENQNSINQASRIIETRYGCFQSPTKRAVYYALDQKKDSSLPHLSGRQLINLLKCHKNKFYSKLLRMESGLS